MFTREFFYWMLALSIVHLPIAIVTGKRGGAFALVSLYVSMAIGAGCLAAVAWNLWQTFLRRRALRDLLDAGPFAACEHPGCARRTRCQSGHMVTELAVALAGCAAVAILAVWGPGLWRSVPGWAWMLGLTWVPAAAWVMRRRRPLPDIMAQRGVIVSELLWGLLGLVLLCAAGLALWYSYPRYPLGTGLLTGMGAVLAVGAALRSRRGTATAARAATWVPVRRAALLAPLAILLPRSAAALTKPGRQWPRLTGPKDPPLSQALGHAWQVPGIDRAVVMVRQTDGQWTWKAWRVGQSGAGVLTYEPHSVAPKHGVLGGGEVPTFGVHDVERVAEARARVRKLRVLTALLDASTTGQPPWSDADMHFRRLEEALRHDATPLEAMAWEAGTAAWKVVRSNLRPGTDLIALVTEAIERPVDDAKVLAQWERITKDRREHFKERGEWLADRAAHLVAALRGVA